MCNHTAPQAKTKSNILYITVTATTTALLIGGKWALAAVPNIEIVSILLAVFSTVWGMPWALLASLVFVVVESLLWGFGTWVLSYIIYWPMLACTYWLLGKYLVHANLPPLRTVIIGTVAILLCTTLFGVITSLVDVMIGYSSSDGLFWALDDILTRFAVMYARGIVFFVVHIVSNTVLFAVGYYPLTRTMYKIKQRLFVNEL